MMLKESDSLERNVSSPCSSLGGSSSIEVSSCSGCGEKIHDRFYLLAVDRQWHASCLKCCECKLPLDSDLTCFARDGNIYCKEDYYRMFAVSRCARCHAGISANELVMRARDLVYHLHCFSCASCGIMLSKGDHFGMREGLLYCRPHYELLDFCDHSNPVDVMFHSRGSPDYFTSSTAPQHSKGRPRKKRVLSEENSPCVEMPVSMRMAQATIEMLHHGELSSSMESLSYDSSVTSPASSNGHQSQRTKRMRTSFKHHQLRTMKTYFAINQNPDAKDLKQLAQKTSLSKRVLQVWFQNARAKWRRNLMRQEGSTNNNIQHQGSSDATSVVPGMIDTNNLHQSLDELRHHMQSQNSQTLNFSDIY